MRPHFYVSVFCLLVGCADANAQTLIRPRIYTRSVETAAAEQKPDRGEGFTDAGLVLPLDGSLFSANAQIYSLAVAPFKAQCTPRTGNASQQDCVEKPLFKLTLDTNVIQSLSSQVDAVREYVLSRKGAPGSITLPFLRFSTLKPGDVAHLSDDSHLSIFSFEGFASGRWIPLSNDKQNFSLSVGASAEVQLKVTASKQSASGESSYPGVIYVSVTPSWAHPVGNSLRALVFDTVSNPSSMVLGAEFRAGFQFSGTHPISVGLSGTWGHNGFKASASSVGFSFQPVTRIQMRSAMKYAGVRCSVVVVPLLTVGVALSTLSCVDDGVAYVNPLQQAAIACPSDVDNNLTDPEVCSTTMEPGPNRRPKGLELAGVNRLPSSLFVDMVADDSNFSVCRDLFEGASLQSQLQAIPIAEVDRRVEAIRPGIVGEARRRMLAAVAGVRSWGYCHRVNKTADSIIHATFDAAKSSIVLYSTSCTARAVYGHSVTSLDLGHRFFLVTSHEVGHSIDAATGRLPTVSDPAAEERATWYGTYLAQCSSRLWQKLLIDNRSVDRTESQRRERDRILADFRAHEGEIASLRDNIDNHPASLQGRTSVLSRLFACTSSR